MTPVRVIKAEGATLRGPCTVKLSKDQWARRVSVLGPVPKRLSALNLDGGQVLYFKLGETIEIDDFEGRLNPALFEDLSKAAAADQDADATIEDGGDQDGQDGDDEDGGDQDGLDGDEEDAA